MTGWGQSGPLAQAAGHDLNYVALTGMLSLSAHRGERPIVPPTVVGDGGRAGPGVWHGLRHPGGKTSGQGRVVDAAIVDIVAMLGGIAQWIRGSGMLDGPHPSLFHDSPFYDVYRCADGGCITLGALEPQFMRCSWKTRSGRHGPGRQFDPRAWPALGDRLTALFASQRARIGDALLEGTDVFCAGAQRGRGGSAPAQRGAGHLCVVGRCRPDVAPGAALSPLDGSAG